MKNKILIGIYAITLLFIYTSCTRDNYLDIVPKGKIIPNKIEDYRLLLDQTQAGGLGISFSTGFINKHTNSIYGADHILLTPETVALNGIDQNQINLYLFRDVIYGPAQSDSDWEVYYKQIYAANLILEGLANVSNGTIKEIKELESEAKLHRAYAYFNLVNIYAVHYNVETASTDLGVPLRNTSSLININLTRSTVNEVYSFIVEEIKSSIDYLPDTQPLNLSFRPSKTAAYGFLSKVQLYKGNYEDALFNVNKALAFYSELRDINNDEVINEPGSPVERYWPSVLEDKQLVWHKNLVLDLTFTEEYASIFESNDLRNQLFAPIREREFIDIDGYTFVANQGVFYSGSDGITTPDLYLIRSECNARLGFLNDAINDLNTLRINRFKSGEYTPISFTNKELLLQFVKEERRREFPSSVERAFDIKRYNNFDNDNISVVHTYKNETVTISPNSVNWAQPIGLLYINQNPEIKQNPRE
ncbi:RagB/SusD family nutrient uptake outer membrane protein [Cellulophaga fucicola]|uniref:RagB/SusD family nutrient uptake outer membrane protein n=1 Tax=Cellulophaga fucicola TaxID=76595 RepID=UPI003EB9E738